MKNNLGYVVVDLSEASKQMLFDTISQKIPEKDYFKSSDPGYTYINGNVCQKCHLTICYGIKNTDLGERFKAAKLKLNWQLDIKIKNIQINLGYKGEYYIVVAIPELDQDIFLLLEQKTPAKNWPGMNAKLSLREQEDTLPREASPKAGEAGRGDSFDSWIRQNNDIIPDALLFDPHLALCYIKNQDNKYSTGILRHFQEKLIGKTVKFESVNFYPPLGQEKIILTRF